MPGLGWRQAARVGLASAAAWELGRRLGAPQPVFAVLAVLTTLQPNLFGSLRTLLERLSGVLAGVVLGVAAARAAGASAAAIGALMLLAVLAGQLLQWGGGANVQVGVSALLVAAGPAHLAYGLTRAWETALGGAVAIAATACLWPPDPVARLAEELDAARLHLAADLLAAEAALRADDRTARQVRRRVAGHAAAVEAGLAQLAEAEDAQRWWRRHLMPNGTLDRLEARLRAVAALYRHVRGLSRCALERTAPHPPSEPRAEAARHLAAACAALAPEAAPRTAPFLIEPAEEAVTAYWKHALRAGEAAEAAPVVTALRRLCADLRTALGGGI